MARRRNGWLSCWTMPRAHGPVCLSAFWTLCTLTASLFFCFSNIFSTDQSSPRFLSGRRGSLSSVCRLLHNKQITAAAFSHWFEALNLGLDWSS
ncbi:hypothetical protein BKA80DRAFT_268109 [Phyllosticta citrichinensis]